METAVNGLWDAAPRPGDERVHPADAVALARLAAASHGSGEHGEAANHAASWSSTVEPSQRYQSL